MKKRFKKKRGPVRAKKVMYDGITFASGLEKYMYIALQKAKIKTAYEGMTYEIFPGFMFDNESYERQANGKGDLVNRGSKKILGIKLWNISRVIVRHENIQRRIQGQSCNLFRFP